MKEILASLGLPVVDGKIVFPAHFRRVKIDVGLSVNAPQSQIWLKNDKDLLVIGFEPLRSNIETLMEESSHWTVKLESDLIGQRIFIVPVALSNLQDPEGLSFYVTKDDPGCSSLLKPKNFEILRVETVPVWTLNDFFQLFPFDRFPIIDHLKIDAQGSDLRILEGCDQYLNRVFAITVEIDVEEYEDTTNSEKSISSYLRKFDFTLSKPGFIQNLVYLMKGLKIDVETDDPTFINENALIYSKHRRYFIYQRG